MFIELPTVAKNRRIAFFNTHPLVVALDGVMRSRWEELRHSSSLEDGAKCFILGEKGAALSPLFDHVTVDRWEEAVMAYAMCRE